MARQLMHVEKLNEIITNKSQNNEPHQVQREILQLLSTLTWPDRSNLLVNQYKERYNADLAEELKKTLPPNEIAINKLYEALLDDPFVHDAKYLHKAMKGLLRTDEEALIAVLVNRSDGELAKIKEAYAQMYGHELAKDVAGNTWGVFKAIMLALVEAKRVEGYETNWEQAKKDAQALYNAGEKRWGTDEPVFIKILASQNLDQLKRVFGEYEQLTGHSMEQAVEAEFSGDDLRAMLAICNIVRYNTYGQAVKCIHNAIEQDGGKDDHLIHEIIWNYDSLISKIAKIYLKLYNIPLIEAIQKVSDGKCSQLLKTALVDLIKMRMDDDDDED